MNLKINHRLGVSNVKFFNSFKVNLKFDSIGSTFSVNFYFDPTSREHAEMACVSHFHEAILEHNGETLITGYILSQVFNLSSKKELTTFGGYSKPGVLEDCEIPTSLYPLQADGLSLRQIAQKLIAPFKLKLVVDDNAQQDASSGLKNPSGKHKRKASTDFPSLADKSDKTIDKSTASESQNIKSYLTELATQRNIILSHNEKGDLLLTEANTSQAPLFHVEAGVIGTSMSMSFNGQGMHSHITIQKQADEEGGNAGEYTIKNPYCPIVYRPTVKTQSSGDDNTIQQAAQHALAAELKNIVLTITTDRWEIDGKIVRPNNTITVENPELFIYKKTTWFIEGVELTGDEKKTIAVLTCVLPEVYNQQIPKNIFVNPHENFPRF